MKIDDPNLNRMKSAYEKLISTNQIELDPNQVLLVTLFDELLVDLEKKRLSRKSSALGWLFAKKSSDNIKGLYIWGDVGRGKSMLMDMFFEILPHKRKRRAHFNDFMQDAQERIHKHREAFKQGKTSEEDPIPTIAEALAEEANVLCFDEFTVTDIADAMILGRLFEAMFREGVVIIATSNVEPKNLYASGLNRKIFLPFIDLLLENVEVFNLDARTDFRLEKLNQAPVYYTPLNAKTRKAMDEAWLRLTGVETTSPRTLQLKGRKLEIPQASTGVARLEFKTLCQEPRSAADYLAIAHNFHTVFLENIPVMQREDHNAAKRFILLIDTLYDNHIRIVASAEAKPDKLYQATSGTEAFEFKRTISRLHEMQSVEYIGAS
jgi:cell division protein ZapE